jgi:hypothetical protein
MRLQTNETTTEQRERITRQAAANRKDNFLREAKALGYIVTPVYHKLPDNYGGHKEFEYAHD